MSIWILYSLVIIFLLAFPLLVLTSVQAPEESAPMKQNNTNTIKSAGIAYVLILTFFVFLALLTFVIQRGKSSN